MARLSLNFPAISKNLLTKSESRVTVALQNKQTQTVTKQTNMQKNKEIKYRVFDSKGNYQQSYSAELKGAINWASDCAKRVNGYVVEILFNGASEVSQKVIYDLRAK